MSGTTVLLSRMP